MCHSSGNDRLTARHHLEQELYKLYLRLLAGSHRPETIHEKSPPISAAPFSLARRPGHNGVTSRRGHTARTSPKTRRNRPMTPKHFIAIAALALIALPLGATAQQQSPTDGRIEQRQAADNARKQRGVRALRPVQQPGLRRLPATGRQQQPQNPFLPGQLHTEPAELSADPALGPVPIISVTRGLPHPGRSGVIHRPAQPVWLRSRDRAIKGRSRYPMPAFHAPSLMSAA